MAGQDMIKVGQEELKRLKIICEVLEMVIRQVEGQRGQDCTKRSRSRGTGPSFHVESHLLEKSIKGLVILIPEGVWKILAIGSLLDQDVIKRKIRTSDQWFTEEGITSLILIPPQERDSLYLLFLST